MIDPDIKPRQTWRIRQHYALVLVAPLVVRRTGIGEPEPEHTISGHAAVIQDGQRFTRLRRETFYGITIQGSDTHLNQWQINGVRLD
jgi:hypothetical protein